METDPPEIPPPPEPNVAAEITQQVSNSPGTKANDTPPPLVDVYVYDDPDNIPPHTEPVFFDNNHHDERDFIENVDGAWEERVAGKSTLALFHIDLCRSHATADLLCVWP